MLHVGETRVLSLLHAAGYPVPPLAACRQQFISGPGRSCKGKWEEIWSIWRHYKAHSWFAVFIKTWSRLHQYCHPPVSPGRWDWMSSPLPQQHHCLRANRPSFSDKVSSLLGRKELLLSSDILLFLMICKKNTELLLAHGAILLLSNHYFLFF